MTTRPEKPTAPRAMVNVGWVAERLGCSERHVYRMRDAGLLPASVKLGSIVRWNVQVIEQWITDGCPPVAQG